MNNLIDSLLTLQPTELSSEEAACAALVRLRWPDGSIPCPLCGSPCARCLAHLVCTGLRPHRATILCGTPLSGLRRPRLQALFLALREMAASHSSISARVLADAVGMNHVTLWRHLHLLRSLLPRPRAWPTTQAAALQVCGRSTDAQPAWLRVGCRGAQARVRVYITGGRDQHLVGESVRTWLNGTFHGVTARWLHRYLHEIATRWSHVADVVLEHVLRQLVDGGPCITLQLARSWI